MKLQDYIKNFTFDELYAELELMYEDAEKYQNHLRQAYDLFLSLEVIPSKKNIHYQVMDDPNGEDSFSGAPDSCFNTTWEVCLGKEVQVDEECELSDLELTANAVLCMIFIGRCPRAFLPAKRDIFGGEL